MGQRLVAADEGSAESEMECGGREAGQKWVRALSVKSRELSSGSLAEYVREPWTDGEPLWSWDMRIFLYLCGFFLSTVGCSIYFKKTTNAMPNLVFPIMQTTVSTSLIFFAVLNQSQGLKRYFRSRYQDVPTKSPTRSKLAIIGLLDALGFCLAIVGGIYTKGTTQILLLQVCIPLTTFALNSTEKKRMEFLQLIGSLVIAIGLYLVLAQSNAMQMGDSLVSPFNPLLFNGIFILSTIPAAISNCLRQKLFAEGENVDIIESYAWKCTFQLVFGFFLVPVDAWTKIANLPEGVIHSGPITSGCEDVQHAFKIACRIYQTAIQPSTAVFSFVLYQEGPANIPFMASILRVPLVLGCFSLVSNEAFVTGELPGAVMVILGVILFRMEFSPDSRKFGLGFQFASAPFLGPGIHEAFISQFRRAENEEATCPIEPPPPVRRQLKLISGLTRASSSPLRVDFEDAERYGSCGPSHKHRPRPLSPLAIHEPVRGSSIQGRKGPADMGGPIENAIERIRRTLTSAQSRDEHCCVRGTLNNLPHFPERSSRM